MRCRPLVITLTGVVAFSCGPVLAQGHYEASPEKTTKVSRSSEYKSETKEFSKSVDIELEYVSDDCEAKLNLEYFQRGDKAQVNSTLTNPQCDASFGSYTIQVRYRGEDQELQTTNYEERWSREDAEPIVASNQYFIGDNVDLVRVRSRSLTCTCGSDVATSDNAE